MNKENYDLIIIGTGPAGLSASIYASRYNIKHAVVGVIAGGAISQTHKIGNYLGLGELTGAEFGKKITDHAKSYGIEIKPANVTNIESDEKQFFVSLDSGAVLGAKTVLLATGGREIKLNAKGEDRLKGKGISYCATCDAFFYKDKTVAVLGGANSAASAAIYLADIAKKVYIIYRREALRAEPYWLEKIKNEPKITVICCTNVTEFVGEKKVEKIKLDKPYDGKDELEVDGVFVEIGSTPAYDLASKIGVELDEKKRIKVRSDQSTSIAGFYAAGDVTDGSNGFRQAITAASEGAIAAQSIFHYLNKTEVTY